MSDLKDDIAFTMTPEMRRFEAAMQLRELKPGILLTKKQFDALWFFIGPVIEAARKVPLTSITIARDTDGVLKEVGNSGLIKSIEET